MSATLTWTIQEAFCALSKSRNKQVIVGSKITRDVTVDLLKDMIKVNEFNGTPLGYDDQAADQVKGSWVPAESLSLPDMNVELYPAGHVAGAAMTGIRAEGKSLLYTGDFCLHNTEILKDATLTSFPRSPTSLFLSQRTVEQLGNPRSELINQMFAEITETMKHRGNVLIPTFAFHRSQEMAKRLDQAIENGTLRHCNVYMVSKLANKITSMFNGYKDLFTQEIQQQSKPFEYKHVEEVEKTTEIEEPAVVICTPGFGHAGASLNLLNEWAEIEENTVIINFRLPAA